MSKYDFSWIDSYEFPSARARKQTADEQSRRVSGNAMDSYLQQQQSQQDFPTLEAQSMQGVIPPNPPQSDGGFSIDKLKDYIGTGMDYLSRGRNAVENPLIDIAKNGWDQSNVLQDIQRGWNGTDKPNGQELIDNTFLKNIPGINAPLSLLEKLPLVAGARWAANQIAPQSVQTADQALQNTTVGGMAVDTALDPLTYATGGLAKFLQKVKKPDITMDSPTNALVPYEPPGAPSIIPNDVRQAEFLARIPHPIPEQDFLPQPPMDQLPEGRFSLPKQNDYAALNPGGQDFFLPEGKPVEPPAPQQPLLENPNKATALLEDPMKKRYDAELQNSIDQEFQRLKEIRKNPPGMIDQGGLIRDLTPYQGGEVIGRNKPTSGNPQWYRDFYTAYGRKPTNEELRQIAQDHVLNGEKDRYFGDIPAQKPMQPHEIEQEMLKVSKQLSNENNPSIIQDLANRLDELGNMHERLTNNDPYIAPGAKPYPVKNVEPVRIKTNDQSFKLPQKQFPFSLGDPKARFQIDLPKASVRKGELPPSNIEEVLNMLKKKNESTTPKDPLANIPSKQVQPKEQWQMTSGEFKKLYKSEEAARTFGDMQHKRLVMGAIAEGKPVPKRVLNEYPSIHEEVKAAQENARLADEKRTEVNARQERYKAEQQQRELEAKQQRIQEHEQKMSSMSQKRQDYMDNVIWTKTKSEYVGKKRGFDKQLLEADHREGVEKALEAGKQVPEEVLKDYPDLQQKTRLRDQVYQTADKIEQAAKQRIQSRGNRLNSLPLDQLGDYAIVGAAKLAKGAVKFTDWAESMAKDFGEKIRPNLKRIYEEAHKMNGTKPDYSEAKATNKTKEPTVNQTMKREANDTLNGLNPDTWKDKSMVGLKRETMERNFEDIMGSDSGIMKAEYIEPIKKSEAERIKFLNQQRGFVKDLYQKYKAKDKSKFDQLVQMYGEGVENGGIDLAQLKEKAPTQWKEIKDAAEKMRANYDYLITEANKVLEENGFKPIPYRNNYFPHYESIDNFLSSLGIKIQSHQLPTDINGLTHTFKPGKPFFRHALERLGLETDYGAMEGFDKYAEGISNVIYHTQNIKRLRALEDTIRNRYKNDTHLSNFVSELNDYTNILSGKKALIDRAMGDGFLGRSIYNVMDNLKRRTGANMIGGSFSSALTNFIPLTQAAATTGKQAFVKGMLQTLGNIMKDDGFFHQSDFLIKREGSDPLHRNLWDKTIDKSMWMMKTLDNFVSQTIVRSKYNELVDKGLSHEAALHQADDWAARIMGSRSKGEVPTILANKTMGFFTQFQLEVNNQVSFLLKDMPREYGKNKAALAAAYGQIFLYGYAFNALYEKMTGRKPALDPIGFVMDTIKDFNNPYMDKTTATKNLIKNAGDQIPFASIFTNGGRIPLLSGVPDIMGIIQGKKDWKNEIIKPGVYLTLPAGGSQIRKTIQGTTAMNDNPFSTQKVTGVYDENKKGESYLKYPVENSPMNQIRGALFGTSAFPESKTYYDNARKPLSPEQTKILERSGNNSEDRYNKLMKDRRIQTLLDNIKEVQKDKKVSNGDKKDKIAEIRKLLDEVKAK